ncbi:hypothetical protein, partial [Tritonibacter sp. SIMBA_163]|uniref:hypothetical protein n=1 Tax=Tritonibacter sp. SIMBA_163 TaxID=3080868 RepID=UPI00397EF902
VLFEMMPKAEMVLHGIVLGWIGVYPYPANLPTMLNGLAVGATKFIPPCILGKPCTLTVTKASALLAKRSSPQSL